MDGVDTSWSDVFQGLTLGVGGALISRLNAPSVGSPGAATGNAAAAPTTNGLSGTNTAAKLAQLAANPLAWLVLGLSGFAIYKLARG